MKCYLPTLANQLQVPREKRTLLGHWASNSSMADRYGRATCASELQTRNLVITTLQGGWTPAGPFEIPEAYPEGVAPSKKEKENNEDPSGPVMHDASELGPSGARDMVCGGGGPRPPDPSGTCPEGSDSDGEDSAGGATDGASETGSGTGTCPEGSRIDDDVSASDGRDCPSELASAAPSAAPASDGWEPSGPESSQGPN